MTTIHVNVSNEIKALGMKFESSLRTIKHRLADERSPQSIVSSFDDIQNKDKGDVFVQYSFLNCENTYFSRKWWDNLGPSQQEQLKKYAVATYYDGGAFVPSQPRLVDWQFHQ